MFDPGGIGGVAAILGHHLSQLETWKMQENTLVRCLAIIQLLRGKEIDFSVHPFGIIPLPDLERLLSMFASTFSSSFFLYIFQNNKKAADKQGRREISAKMTWDI